jgi:hypothetical protein
MDPIRPKQHSQFFFNILVLLFYIIPLEAKTLT